MKAEQIKWADRHLGLVICKVLTFWSKLFPRTPNLAPKKVVFIKLIEQGASVLAYSALKKAVEEYGKENVYFLVFSENRPILDFLNVLDKDNVIEIEDSGFVGFLKSTVSALIYLRKQKVDVAIDMEFFSRASAILAYLSGAKRRVGLHRFNSEQPYRGNLMTHKILYNPYIHVSKYYLSLLDALREESNDQPKLKQAKSNFKIEHPQLDVNQSKIKAAINLIPDSKQNRGIVILNANASDMLPLRKWEGDKFAKLAQQIAQVYPEKLLVFTGIEKEKIAIDKLTANLDEDHFLNLAGKTSLDQLMALFSIADLVITNDSGPAHFASIFKTQVLVLFGPETPELFAPLGENVHVVYRNLVCSPCVNVFNHRFSPCSNNLCMQNITVNEVFEKVKSLL